MSIGGRRPLPSRLLVIVDAGCASDLAEAARRACSAGARWLEVRRAADAPGASDSASRLAELRAVLAAAPGACVLVNDRVDLAVLAGAHGAHVGQGDLPPAAARRVLGDVSWLGLSTHDETQIMAAQELPCDYVALGPILVSSTKSGHAPVVGMERLAQACALSRLPVVAIGGIGVGAATQALAAGAAAVAVASAAIVGDIERNVAGLLAALSE
jgi:thiamine-phosphate pyrophosphorylase